MKYSFKELVDVTKLQELTDQLYTAASIPSAIISVDGEIITGSGWQRICTEFHRKHPQIEQDCIDSDIKIRKLIDEGAPYAIYKCPRGLVDATSPVIINKEHVANVFAGQVFLEPPDEAKEKFFREQANIFGFNEIEYIKAFREIPIFTQDEFLSILNFLSILAQLIAKMGYTRLKELESTKNLQKSEERYRELVEKTDNLITKVDQDSNFTYVNYVGEILFGVTTNNLIGMSAFRFVHAEDLQRTKSWFYENIRKKIHQSSFENRHVNRKTGEVSHLLWNIHFKFDEKNKIKEINGIAHNITEQKVAEQALRMSEYQYRTTLESMGDMIHVVTNDFCVIFANNNFKEQIIKLGLGEIIIDRNLFDLVPFLSDSVIREYQQVFDSGEALITEEFIEIQGKIVYTETRKIPNYKNNKVNRVVTVIRDITARKLAEEDLRKAHDALEQKVYERTKELRHEINERKQIEENLRKAKKEAELANNAKSEFLSNISHEIRTPMHQILSFSKFGVDKIDIVKKEKLLHYFFKIKTIGHSLLLLLNDLLDLSKLESGKIDYDMQKNDIKQIIYNVSNEFLSIMTKKELFLEISEKNIPAEVFCDELKISQVIRNYLSNAIKFTAKNKMISISIESSELLVNDMKKVPALLVNVIDQGIGVPEDELVTVFDKFIQSSKTKTNSGGTGLGLSICKEIIKNHHGKVWAENNSDGGSTFSFILPYEQMIN
jgi:PAS domain S-box-containing protein